MISFIEKEIVEGRKWLTGEEMLDVVAIAESTPGPISVNAATFVGTKVGGFLGALFATLGLILPAFTIICILSLFIMKFNSNKYVSYLFKGLRAGVCVLLLNASVSFFKKMNKNIVTILILIFSLIVSFVFNVDAIYILLYTISVSIIYTFTVSVSAKIGGRKK